MPGRSENENILELMGIGLGDQTNDLPELEIEDPYWLHPNCISSLITEINEKYYEIIQGYFSDSGATRVRLEYSNETNKTRVIFGSKVSDGLGNRIETEFDHLDTNFYKVFRHVLERQQLMKRRYKKVLGTEGSIVKVDIDLYRGQFTGMVRVEFEFPNEEVRSGFVVPNEYEILGPATTSNADLSSGVFPPEFPMEKLPEFRFTVQKIFAGKEIPEYQLEEGIEKLAEEVRVFRNENPGKICTVAIAGGSASGKTSHGSAKLKEIFGDECLIISMDDYYKGLIWMNEVIARGEKPNWDDPDAINFALFIDHIKQLQSGQIVEKPIYGFGRVPNSSEIINPKPIIIFEGLYSLHRDIQGLANIKAFIDVGVTGMAIRRITRDVERTGQSPSEILNQLFSTVIPTHITEVLDTKINADIVIRNDHDPVKESSQIKLGEKQEKYSMNITPEQMRRNLVFSGAIFVADVCQNDDYYVNDTGENSQFVRVRKQGETNIFTYKGPKVSASHRYKIETTISDEDASLIKTHFKKIVSSVTKKRTIYTFGCLIINFDTRVKVHHTSKGDIELGNFIEIKYDKNHELTKDERRLIDNIRCMVGGDNISKSYVEIV